MDKTDKDYCFCENADFMPAEVAGGIAVMRKKDDSPELRDCLQHPDQMLQNADIMKDSRTTKAGIIKLSNGKEVFIKCFNNKGLIYTLKYMFREARPFRVLTAAWALEQAGIPTPRPLAVLARYKFGLPGNAYLIRNVVPDIVSTLDFFAKLKGNADLQESYLESVAAMYRKMHNAGIYHGDAKCSNIYVEACGEDKFSYGVWDLLSCQISKYPVSDSLREKELSRIAWSFAEISNREEKTVNEADIKKQLTEKYKNF